MHIQDLFMPAASFETKKAGDLVYVLGMTKAELGGSEYFNMLAYTGNKVIATLEGTREFINDDISDMRRACCYAFADYLCKLRYHP